VTDKVRQACIDRVFCMPWVGSDATHFQTQHMADQWGCRIMVSLGMQCTRSEFGGSVWPHRRQVHEYTEDSGSITDQLRT
jgi:hypothetical protein